MNYQCTFCYVHIVLQLVLIITSRIYACPEDTFLYKIQKIHGVITTFGYTKNKTKQNKKPHNQTKTYSYFREK